MFIDQVAPKFILKMELNISAFDFFVLLVFFSSDRTECTAARHWLLKRVRQEVPGVE